jgi:hypothetical protein
MQEEHQLDNPVVREEPPEARNPEVRNIGTHWIIRQGGNG